MTGLTKVIGNPRELETNTNEPEYFNRVCDLSIPMEDTNEFTKHNAKNIQSAAKSESTIVSGNNSAQKDP